MDKLHCRFCGAKLREDEEDVCHVCHRELVETNQETILCGR